MQEHYWSLVVEPGWVQAAIWTIESKQVKVLSFSPSTRWEKGQDLIEAIDAALSAAVQKLDEDIPEPRKTVFGIVPSWVGDNEIKPEYLDQIKEICSKLSLEPVGFVVLPEAIAYYSKTQEGSPLNAVILGLNQNTIEVSVFKIGSLVGSVSVSRSVSIIDDLVEGLTRFGREEPFPSRFLLFDGREGELEEAKQALMRADWASLGDKIKFLHTPQIELIEPETKVAAVSLSGASEITEIIGIKEFERDFDDGESQDQNQGLDGRELEEEPTDSEAGGLDFVVNQDISEQGDSGQEPVFSGEPLFNQSKVKRSLGQGLGFLKNFKLRFPFGILGKIKKPVLPGTIGSGEARRRFQMSKQLLMISGVALSLVLIGLGLAWWFLPKATVTIYVAPKKLEKSEIVTLDSQLTTPDLAEKTLPVKLEEVSLSGDKTGETTGTKTVGDRATGEVTIYRVGSALTLDSGTELAGPNDLEFTLDEDVQLASGSAISPSKTKAKVIASQYGSEYNLAANTTFSVANYPTSDIEAKNETDFSGGSSREIAAVSQEDRDQLEEALLEELIDQGKGQIETKLGPEQIFISNAVFSEVSERDFSHKVGDEASTLKLSLSVKISGLVVSRSQLSDLAKEVLADQVPASFVLRDDQLNVEFKLEEEEENYWLVETSFEANLLPEINTDEVVRQIAGRQPSVAQDYLSTIPGCTRAEIKSKPTLPGKLGSLPRVTKNIEIEVAAER